MQGETDLNTLLSGLNPVMDKDEYVFVCVRDWAAMQPVREQLRGLFVEPEGITLIVPAAVAVKQGWAAEEEFRCITCQVHSSLTAVGLTATMSAALTKAGISANVVAAYYHDHLFVPSADADAALNALRALSAR